MNNKRRKDINTLIDKIQSLQSDIRLLSEELEEIRNEEEEYLYNIPENLQSSERYNTAENAVENLDDAFNALEEALSQIDDAVGCMEHATE